MDFDKAEQQFRRLEELRSTGRISDQEYRQRLGALRVTDQDGQIWMPQERTGQWYVYYGNQWMPATPPGRAPTAAAIAGAPGAEGISQQKGSGGGVARWIAIWGGVWIVIAIVALVLSKGEIQLLLGIAAAAAFSLILMLPNVLSQWSGVVTDVRTERERVKDNDHWHYETVAYAYVRHDNGKVKRTRAMPGWQVGDRLEKRKGDTAVRKL